MAQTDDEERTELARAAKDGDLGAARRLVRLLERTSGEPGVVHHAAHVVDAVSPALENAASARPTRVLNAVLLVGDEGDRRAAVSKAATDPALARVVWSQNLDTTGRRDSDASLAPAVMACLSDAIARRRGRGPAYERRDFDGIRRGLEDLRRVQADVAMAYDSNLRARAGAMDPESYAIEVERQARSVIGLDERIDQALASALADVGSSLIVQPVIDLEYQIQFIPSLLKLPRLFRSPRILFLYGSSRELVGHLRQTGGDRAWQGQVVELE